MMATAQCLVPKSVATIIKSDEPIALFTYFYGHSINLAASHSMKSSRSMKDALENNSCNYQTHQIFSEARRKVEAN